MKSSHGDISIPDNVSLADFLGKRIIMFGKRTALVDSVTGLEIRYDQILPQVSLLATSLWRRYGLTKGHTVCVILPNCLEYILLVYAVLHTGARLTTCNPAYRAGEIRTQLQDCGACLIITNSGNVETASEAAAGLPIKDIILTDAGQQIQRNYPTISGITRDGASCDTELPEVKCNPKEDVAVLLYSSGTTGKPKGVMLTHYNIIANILQICHPTLKMGGPTDVYLVNTPMFHIYGLNVIVNVGLFMGAKLITAPRFQPEEFLGCIQKYKVTFLHVTPPTALFLSQHSLVDKFDISSVHTVFSGGAPLPENVAQAVQQRLGVEVRQGYGMTEASPGILHTIPRSMPFSSVGTPLPNSEVRIVDIEREREAEPNMVGHILLRGPQVMKGYLGNEEATANTIDKDGWLSTGDLGYYDKNGHFYIVDRLKELIKYNAFQVAPAELESLLLSHPCIDDAAVVGKPDVTHGELPTAFVVTKATSLTAQNILQFVKDNVASYKQLRGGVLFVEFIPKSPSGKILRRVLKEQLLQMPKL